MFIMSSICVILFVENNFLKISRYFIKKSLNSTMSCHSPPIIIKSVKYIQYSYFIAVMYGLLPYTATVTYRCISHCFEVENLPVVFHFIYK